MAASKPSAENLITENIDVWTSAIKKRGSQGRGSNKKIELYGIKKLRELILELAVRGLLVPQDSNDEPASVLLEKIAAEKEQLIKDGKIKKQKALPEISEDEKPFELPNGWEFERLGNLTLRLGSGSTPRGGRSAYVESGIPFLRSQNVWNDGLHLDDIAYIDEKTHSKMDNTKVLPNDVLLNITGASLGRSTIFPKELAEANVSQHVTIIRLIQPSLSSFVHLGIQSPIVQRLVWGRQVGMAIEGLSKKVLELFEFPVPPQAEQPRIIAKVDELMALCDQLEQQTESSLSAHQTLVETLLNTLLNSDQNSFDPAWERIAQHFDVLFTTEHSIDQLKQTILQLAVMGKLVPQDPNDEPASVLLEKIAAEKEQLIKDKKIKKQKPLAPISDGEKPFDLPKGWEWVRVNNLINPEREISYGVIKLEAEPESGGISTLRCSDVRPRFLELEGVRRVHADIESSYKRTRLKGGEVLVNVRGTLGGVALVPNELAGFNIAREVAMLAFLPQMYGEYAVDMIASPYFWEMIEGNLKGIAYKGLNLSILRELPIPLPPKSEQLRIVAKVSVLMTLCDALKNRISKSQTTQMHLSEAMAEKALN